MKIRKATIKDLDELERIYVEGCVSEVKLQFPKKSVKSILKEMKKYERDRKGGFKEGIKSKDEYWVIIVDNNKIAGFGQAVIDKNDKSKAGIEKVYVDKEFRRKGVGMKLMKEIIRWLKEKTVKSVSSGIFIKNKPSINIHEKLGFEVTAVRMQKKLK